jgi:cellulose biosynthesis protein BcsQ
MLNFMKGSIFTRNKPAPPQEEAEPDIRMLAVWGSPGSGKTTVSVRLAKYLADHKRDVALLLCDMTAPMLPCVCPPAELECERSLGSILAAAHITDTLVRQNCVTLKKMSHLTLIGMLKGENVFTYPPYTQELAAELLDHLRDVAPTIIVDCGSYIAHDVLSAVALLSADSVLRLVNCDLKSVSYLSSQLPLLKEQKWDADKQYKAASDVKSNQAGEHIEQVLGSVAFQIPHSSELENLALEGKPAGRAGPQGQPGLPVGESPKSQRRCSAYEQTARSFIFPKHDGQPGSVLLLRGNGPGLPFGAARRAGIHFKQIRDADHGRRNRGSQGAGQAVHRQVCAGLPLDGPGHDAGAACRTPSIPRWRSFHS